MVIRQDHYTGSSVGGLTLNVVGEDRNWICILRIQRTVLGQTVITGSRRSSELNEIGGNERYKVYLVHMLTWGMGIRDIGF